MILTDKQQAILDSALARIADGESMRSIGRDPAMPAATTLYDWIEGDDSGKASEHYARARREQADTHAEEIVAIADDQDIDANSRRVMVDARKWVASKLKPGTYGDKLDHKHSGSLVIGIRQNERVEDKD